MEDSTSDAISERLHREICEYDDNQPPFDGKPYYIRIIKYAQRRAIVQDPSEFIDVIQIFIENFSPQLREQIIALSSNLQSINRVVTDAIRKIIKARARSVYYDYLQYEPLRWCLLNGDGNGKGDGSVIAECVDKPESLAEEELTPIEQLAQKAMKEYAFKTTTDNEELYCYDGSKYVSGQEWRIKQLCQIAESSIRSSTVQEVINHIKRSTYVNRAEFDSKDNIINVKNGLLNLHTWELNPHTPEYLSIRQLPVEYKPGATCPEIINFLRDVLRREDIGTMFRLIGYCLLPDCRYQVSVMLYGKGANGKGTLLDLVTAFLGGDNCSHRSLQQIDKDRFAIADLFGKMANTFADLKSMKLSETGNFKMAVTGDWLEGEFKFKDAFKFRNKAKLWFSANEIPESEDKTDAFYRRWMIFHFDNQYLYGKEDVNLFKKLTTHQELSGLLNVALVGLSRLIKEGGFHDRSIDDIRRDYEIHTNDVNAFLHEECIVDITNSDYSTLATDAYAAYVNFCVKRGTRPIDMNPFGKKLADKGIYNQRHKEYGQSDHYYDGMILRKKLTGEYQTIL